MEFNDRKVSYAEQEAAGAPGAGGRRRAGTTLLRPCLREHAVVWAVPPRVLRGVWGRGL